MLGIGLAVGVAVGYSLNDRPITAEERAYLREREVLNAYAGKFNAAYALKSDIKQLGVQPGVGNIQLPQPKLQRIEINVNRSHPVFEKYRTLNLGPDLDQDMDLIDMRYTPPDIKLP